MQRALDAAEAGFAVCLDPADQVDLEPRKIYRVKMDREGARHGMIRIFDESGEDYLYPVRLFVPVRLSERAARLLRESIKNQDTTDGD